MEYKPILPYSRPLSLSAISVAPEEECAYAGLVLRVRGFGGTLKSVSADTKGDPQAVRSHAQITLSLLDGPFGKAIMDNGWADKAMIEHLKQVIQEWGEHPDAFFANVHVEVIGWKPD